VLLCCASIDAGTAPYRSTSHSSWWFVLACSKHAKLTLNLADYTDEKK